MRFRCSIRIFLCFLFLILYIIAYKFVIMKRYISSYNLENANTFLILKKIKELARLHKENASSSFYMKEFNINQQLFKDLKFNPFNGERIIHLDLKGAPPSIAYFQQLFPLLHALNVTGLLIEYEDIFPYSERFTHAINTYSKEDVKLLVKTAKKNKLDVIPLVQTFGHLEFLLKVYKFFHLREVHRYPQSICPSHEDTFDVITGMLDEVITLHPDIRYIHIGCDEVYQLGVCKKCASRMLRNRWSSNDLFLAHISRIAKYIRSTYPHVMPLMWDDELRTIPANNLKKFDIGAIVQPVIWWYQPEITLHSSIWNKYASIFSDIWVASSFKGATGPDQILSNISYHFENQKSWMEVIANYSYLINFKGMIVTGWQRYDHFAVLCELLPASIPSLVNTVLLLKGAPLNFIAISKKVKDVLACGKDYEFSDSCIFPGVDVYNAIVGFSKLKTEIDQVQDSSYIKGWLTPYNLEMGYFNPLLVEELTYKVRECQNSLKRSKKLLESRLKKIYDLYTVTEWIETNVKPYIMKMDRLSGILHYVINITEWAPRPIELLNGRGNN